MNSFQTLQIFSDFDEDEDIYGDSQWDDENWNMESLSVTLRGTQVDSKAKLKKSLDLLAKGTVKLSNVSIIKDFIFSLIKAWHWYVWSLSRNICPYRTKCIGSSSPLNWIKLCSQEDKRRHVAEELHQTEERYLQRLSLMKNVSIDSSTLSWATKRKWRLVLF